MRFIENVLAAIGLLALILGASLVLLSLEHQSYPQCDVRIQSANGVSCYQIKEYRK